jgi:hypothetical protein
MDGRLLTGKHMSDEEQQAPVERAPRVYKLEKAEHIARVMDGRGIVDVAQRDPRHEWTAQQWQQYLRDSGQIESDAVVIAV